MLGVLYELTGLISAMAAHGIYDIEMLQWAERIRVQGEEVNL